MEPGGLREKVEKRHLWYQLKRKGISSSVKTWCKHSITMHRFDARLATAHLMWIDLEANSVWSCSVRKCSLGGTEVLCLFSFQASIPIINLCRMLAYSAWTPSSPLNVLDVPPNSLMAFVCLCSASILIPRLSTLAKTYSFVRGFNSSLVLIASTLDRHWSWRTGVNALQRVFIFSVVEGMLTTSCPGTHKRWHNSCTHSHPLHRCPVDRDLWSLATAGRGGWAVMGPPAAATALCHLPNLIQTSGAQAVARMSWCILGLNAERSRMEWGMTKQEWHWPCWKTIMAHSWDHGLLWLIGVLIGLNWKIEQAVMTQASVLDYLTLQRAHVLPGQLTVALPWDFLKRRWIFRGHWNSV